MPQAKDAEQANVLLAIGEQLSSLRASLDQARKKGNQALAVTIIKAIADAASATLGIFKKVT